MALKQHRRGTHRICAPEATLRRLRPELARFGITRIADITGLDRVGIPVMLAIRPEGRALAQAQGKGLDRHAAEASGLMEAIEAWHAERPTLPVTVAALGELVGRATVELGLLPIRRGRRLDPERRLAWVAGLDLIDGRELLVPLELVHTDYTLPHHEGWGLFCASSNGLASGNHPMEALSHALLEVIERDAVSLWRLGGAARRAVTRVDPGSVDDPDCRGLLARFAAADLAVAIWNATSDVGVACFAVEIIERGQSRPFFYRHAAAGSGAHPDRAIALARALTEAAQSRLTFIAGSRDDVPELQPTLDDAEREAQHREIALWDGSLQPFAATPDLCFEDFTTETTWLIDRLRAVGVPQIVAVDLSRPEFAGIHVVRVVAPGLEADIDHPDYGPGVRAGKALLAQ